MRHNLEIIRVIGRRRHDQCTAAASTRAWTAMRPESRWLHDLEEQGYLVKIEDYTHNVGTCYRCRTDGGAA